MTNTVRTSFLYFLVLWFLLFTPYVVYAEPNVDDFATYMLEWRDKSQLAQDYLRKSQEYLKSGQTFQACISQRKASQLGVKAFTSLLLAKELSANNDEIDNIKSNLKRWKLLETC